MGKRLVFFTKIMSMLTLFSISFSYGIYYLSQNNDIPSNEVIQYNKASIDYSNDESNIMPLWPLPNLEVGYITLEETSVEIIYGNEIPSSNIWCSEQGRYAVGIYDYSSDQLSASCDTNDDLSFDFEDGFDIDGNPIKVMYINGVDKVPANCFDTADGSVYNPLEIQIKCDATDTHFAGYAYFELWVFPKEITEVEWINKDLVYNGEEQFPEGRPLGLINDDTCELLFESVGGSQSGDRVINLTGLSNSNYYLSEELLITDIDYYINPAPLTITPELEITYGDAANVSDITYKIEGLMSDDTFNTNIIASQLNYNQYDPIYDVSGELINYPIKSSTYDYEGDYVLTIKEGKLIINPALLEIDYGVDKFQLTYGDTYDVSAINYTVDGLLGSDVSKTLEELGYSFESTYNQYDPIFDQNGNEIQYYIALRNDIPGNYIITNNTLDMKISQKEIELEWSNLSLDYNGKYQLPTVSVVGLVNNDKCNARLSDDLGRKDVGTYTIHLLEIDNNNYVYSGDKTVQFTINTIDVEDFTFDNCEAEYNGEKYEIVAPLPAGIESVGYVYNNGEVTEIKDAGTYNVTAYYTVNSNYNSVEPKTAVITIKPKSITIVLDYSNLTYTGSEQSVGVSYEGLIEGDNINPNVSGTKGTDAGTYPININDLGNPNYQFIGEMPSWIISKADVKIDDTNNISQEYNGQAFVLPTNLPEGVKEIVYTIKLGDGTSVNEIKNAGTYYITKEYITDDNYNTIEEQEFTVTIEPKEITVKFEYVNGDYSGNEHNVDINIEGIVEGESLTPNITGDKATQAGSYNSSVSINDPNYVIKEGNETFDWVIPKATAIKPELNNIVKTYDGNNFILPTQLPKGILKIEYVITLDDNIVTEIKNVGVYKVNAKYTVDENYNEIEEDNISITINKRDLSIVFGDSIKTYNGKEQELIYTIVGLVSGETANVTVEGNKATNVGAYNAKIYINDSNYNLSGKTSMDWEIKAVSSDNFDPNDPNVNNPDINNPDNNSNANNPNSNTKTDESNMTFEFVIAGASLIVLIICYFIFKMKKGTI